MQDRIVRIALLAALLLLGAFVAEPYVTRYFLSETTPRAVTARGDLSEAEHATIALFERVSPSVVHVFARSERDPRTLQGGGTQSGSGFVWDAAGHVVTNNHVVENTGPIAVRLADGDIVEAEVVGTAPNYDLAVLRVGRVRTPPPPIAIGTSSDLKVGQFAYAIGNPFGLDQTLTTGVISALQRRLPTAEGREIADVIQTDASINPGNSGGPLLDSAGRLIGVNTAIFSPSGASAGIGFAIPVDVVNRIVPELIRRGNVPTPGIGIVAAPEAVSTRLGVDGIVIVQVQPNSPASKAGIRGVDPTTGEIGDIIVAVNGKPVQRVSQLSAELERVGIGRPVQVTILRNGRRLQLDLSAVDIGQARL